MTFNEAVKDYMEWVEKVGRARKRSYSYTKGTIGLISNIEKHFGVRRDSHHQVRFNYQGYELVVEVKSSVEFFLCLNY